MPSSRLSRSTPRSSGGRFAPPLGTTRLFAGANLPPELRGVDLDNLLDGIEY